MASAAADEGDQLLCLAAHRLHRRVVRLGVEKRVLATITQQVGGEPQLDRAVLPVVEQILERVAIAQDARALGVINRAAVVGIDQGEVEEASALVEVRYTRYGALQDGPPERDGRAAPRDLHQNRPHTRHISRAVRQQAIDEVRRCLFVGLVGLDPLGVSLGLAKSLRHVGLEAFPQSGAYRRIILLQKLDRPDADQRLQEHVLIIRVRRLDGADFGLPYREGLSPKVGRLRHREQAGTRILAALGVVGRRRGQGMWPTLRPLDIVRMEVGKRHAKPTWLTTDLVEYEETGVAIEQRVFQALGHDGTGELLEMGAEAIDQIRRGAAGPPHRQRSQQHRADEVVHAAVG